MPPQLAWTQTRTSEHAAFSRASRTWPGILHHDANLRRGIWSKRNVENTLAGFSLAHVTREQLESRCQAELPKAVESKPAPPRWLYCSDLPRKKSDLLPCRQWGRGGEHVNQVAQGHWARTSLHSVSVLLFAQAKVLQCFAFGLPHMMTSALLMAGSRCHRPLSSLSASDTDHGTSSCSSGLRNTRLRWSIIQHGNTELGNLT